MGRIKGIVIADAGPIIHLDELESLDILVDFGKVIVPEAVWHEVQRHRQQVFQPFGKLFCRQSVSIFSPLVYALVPLYTLHAGEQEALHLCMELPNSLLLTDDTAARLAAKNMGISAHGTLGLLIRAIRQQSRSKSQVLTLLQDIPLRTSLHVRPSLFSRGHQRGGAICKLMNPKFDAYNLTPSYSLAGFPDVVKRNGASWHSCPVLRYTAYRLHYPILADHCFFPLQQQSAFN